MWRWLQKLSEPAKLNDPSEASAHHQQSEAIQTPHQCTAATPTSHQQQVRPVAPGLPSQVDETLAACPRFRILVVGKSGTGKSSLIKSIFNIDPDKIDICRDCAGKADIERGYTSPENPRFILHESQCFEAGFDGNCTKVEDFLNSRQKNNLSGRIHTIWFCVETPLAGSRLLQKSEERVLELANNFNIPTIAVFTKYDLLETLFFFNNTAMTTPEKLASESFDHSVKELKLASPTNFSIPCVKVSTVEPKENEYVINLTKATHERLEYVEEELQVLWAAAQQVNARLKVDAIIRYSLPDPSGIPNPCSSRIISEGFKKYWLNDLFRNWTYDGHILMDCIQRLHEDVLKVWNFNDQTGILSGVDFFVEMIHLVKPLIEKNSFSTGYVESLATKGGIIFVLLLRKDFALRDISYLYDEYQQLIPTSKVLGTYVINLVLILHGVFTDTLTSDPPRALLKDAIFKIVERHKDNFEKETLDNIGDLKFAYHPEEVIKCVLTKQLLVEPVRFGF